MQSASPSMIALRKPIILHITQKGAFIGMDGTAKPKKLLDQVRDALRVKHYAYRTEKTYVFWIRRYILFRGKKHPSEMGSMQIQEFLTHLAVWTYKYQRAYPEAAAWYLAKGAA